MPRHPLDPEQLLALCHVDLARPFKIAESGLTHRQLARLAETGHVRRLLREVYVASAVPDTLGVRAQALALVVPPGGVVTDVSAAWLHGIDLVPPHDIWAVPDIHAFHREEGGALARRGVRSGQRVMPLSDTTEIDGVIVTTLLRTACDLGRLQPRERAFASLDAMLRAGVDGDELVREVKRFRGYRGVRQLRAFAPLADGRSDSVAESIMRLRWLETGLPAPEPQRPVDGPGTTWFLDLGVDELFFAVEYDGEEFHTEDDDIEHDADRRSWIRGNTPWTVEVITKQQLFRGDAVFESLLRKWLPEARRTLANRVRGRRWFQNPGE